MAPLTAGIQPWFRSRNRLCTVHDQLGASISSRTADTRIASPERSRRAPSHATYKRAGAAAAIDAIVRFNKSGRLKPTSKTGGHAGVALSRGMGSGYFRGERVLAAVAVTNINPTYAIARCDVISAPVMALHTHTLIIPKRVARSRSSATRRETCQQETSIQARRATPMAPCSTQACRSALCAWCSLSSARLFGSLAPTA